MTETESLQAERTAILAKLVELAGVVDASEGGRSINVSATSDRLERRLKYITERLAQLSGPWAVTSVGTRQ